MRSYLWLPLIVGVAFTAGTAAFLLSTPDQSSRIARSELGFARLDRTRIDAVARSDADAWRDRHLRGAAVASATSSSRRWLVSLAGGDGTRASRAAGASGIVVPAPAPGAAVELQRWADGIPATRWKVATRAATLPADDPGGVATVRASIEVTLFQARSRVRTQRIPVVLGLAPVVASRDAAVRRWRLRSLTIGGERTWLRAYDDPTIVVRDVVHVVAPTDLRPEAERLADHAQAVLPRLSARYAAVGRTGVATVWLLPDRTVATAVLGREAPTSRPGAEALGWMDERGEVALDWSQLRSATSAQQRSALRHELAHLATLGALGKVPPMLLEGIALMEEVDSPAGRADRIGTDLGPLAEAYSRGAVRWRELALGDPEARFAAGRDAEGIRIAYLASYATVAYVEERHGHRGLLALLGELAGGAKVEQALRDALRIDLPTLELRVRLLAQRRGDGAAAPA